MDQQQNLQERILNWVAINGYKLKSINQNTVSLERLSDDYPFEVDKRLLEMIMTDEGF